MSPLKSTRNQKQHELAAKAAGYAITWKTGNCKGGPFEGAFIGDQPWRPKDDDGDALRLAIDAGIDIQNEATIGGICIASCAVVQVVRIHDGQIHKANRRAIFDAAVDMGKAAA